MPSTVMLVVSILKLVISEAALINTSPIAVPSGTNVDAKLSLMSLMIDPLLQKKYNKYCFNFIVLMTNIPKILSLQCSKLPERHHI